MARFNSEIEIQKSAAHAWPQQSGWHWGGLQSIFDGKESHPSQWSKIYGQKAKKKMQWMNYFPMLSRKSEFWFAEHEVLVELVSFLCYHIMCSLHRQKSGFPFCLLPTAKPGVLRFQYQYKWHLWTSTVKIWTMFMFCIALEDLAQDCSPIATEIGS